MRTRVKICCISSVAEAWLAINAGADALGLVSHMPSGPGVIPLDSIARIVASVPPTVSTFLLTSSQDPKTIIDQVNTTKATVVQLVDAVEASAYRELRHALPATRLVQVIHVIDGESVDEAMRASTLADALLLDSGDPKGSVKVLGGTGQTHNWEISRAIVQQSSLPIFLAGGLRPSNVRQAIETVSPFGVDLCTGVRDDGALDESRLSHFFRAMKATS